MELMLTIYIFKNLRFLEHMLHLINSKGAEFEEQESAKTIPQDLNLEIK